MTDIITPKGSHADFGAEEFVSLKELVADERAGGEGPLAIDIAPDDEPADLIPFLDRTELIRVGFPAFSDGRGFSLARRIRLLGYSGCMRASGPLVSDQLRAAFRVGFDEVEPHESVLSRQPAEGWVVQEQGSYQNRLFG